MIAIGGALALLGGGANAAPVTFAKGAIVQTQGSDLTLVRDGCGRGMRFSNSRQACVPQGGGGRVYVDPGAAIVQGIIGGAIEATRPGCPRGTRWSNRRGACVYE